MLHGRTLLVRLAPVVKRKVYVLTFVQLVMHFTGKQARRSQLLVPEQLSNLRKAHQRAEEALCGAVAEPEGLEEARGLLLRSDHLKEYIKDLHVKLGLHSCCSKA